MGAGYSEAPLLHRSLKQWPVTYPKISNRRQRARFMMLRSGPDFGTIVQALFWYFFAFAGGKSTLTSAYPFIGVLSGFTETPP